MSIEDARNRAAEAARRLRELGFDVPEMPQNNNFQTAVCSLCGGRGKRAANGGEPMRCDECQGSGIMVVASLVEWNKKLAAMLEQVRQNGPTR